MALAENLPAFLWPHFHRPSQSKEEMMNIIFLKICACLSAHPPGICLHKFMCTMCVQLPEESRKHIRIPGSGVIGDQVPLGMGAGN